MYNYSPDINPIMFSIGPVSAYWYGFMYFISLIFCVWYGKKNSKKNNMQLNSQKIEKLMYIVFFSSCVGGRIGYVIFYNFIYFSQNIVSVLYVWKGGMSFHGGLIGAFFAIMYFAIKNKKKILEISDFIVPIVPFCLGLGRIGNFINSELWGRVSYNCPFSLLFKNSYYQDLQEIQKNPKLQSLFEQYGALPRHPSQLYEFFLEGIILFFLMYFFTQKKRSIGSATGLFLLLYGIMRTFVEIFREPDVQIGILKSTFTMGQILSLPMIFIGLIILFKVFYKKNISGEK